MRLIRGLGGAAGAIADGVRAMVTTMLAILAASVTLSVVLDLLVVDRFPSLEISIPRVPFLAVSRRSDLLGIALDAAALLFVALVATVIVRRLARRERLPWGTALGCVLLVMVCASTHLLTLPALVVAAVLIARAVPSAATSGAA